MSAITAKASRKMKKYAVLVRESRCFLGSFAFSWEQRKFEEIALRSSTICSDVYLPRVEYEDIVSGAGRLNKDIYAKQSSKSGIVFHQGDVLYGKLRPYLQNWLLPAFDGLAVGDFWVLQPQNADSSFVYRLIQSRQFDEVANQSTGTKMPRADWKLVSQTVFSIPSNIGEQAAIGTYFTALDNLITLHQRKCAFLFKCFQTVISKKLVTSTFSWEQRKAIDIADYSKGNGYSKGDLTDAGTPIILYGRLYTKYQFAINEVDTFAVPRNGAVYSQGNEVIVPASGETAEDIARASAIEKSGVLLGGDLNILRPFDFINPLFLALAISNGEPQKELAKKAQGKSVVHIHNSDIQEVTIAYPSRIEQDRIVSVFQQLDNLITLHQRECISFTGRAVRLIQAINKKQITSSWEQRKVQDVADRYDNLRIPVAANLRVHGATPYYGANGIQDYVDGFTHDGEFVLVAEDGANDLKNYPVKCVNGRIWVNNHAHVLQGKAGIADNSFLAFAISQSDIESLLVGGGRAKLNAETLMGIEFRLPCLQEQYRIGECLKQLDNLITLHQRKPFLMKWRTSDANRNQTNRLVL